MVFSPVAPENNELISLVDDKFHPVTSTLSKDELACHVPSQFENVGGSTQFLQDNVFKELAPDNA
jgi:hypothetical protein